MLTYAGSVARYPARALFLCYLLAIVAGSFLLCLPIARRPTAQSITILESSFTATSAVCVTGLTVRSTGYDYSLFGQTVILILIQLGGIGIMTVTTFAMLLITGQESLRSKATITETLGARPVDRLVRVSLRVVLLTLVIEAVGAAILFTRFSQEDRPLGGSVWRSVFHSVSAFCNAGFALEDDSLVVYRTDPTINLTVAGLIILGGIGFPVLTDLFTTRQRLRNDRRVKPSLRRFWEALQLNSKLILLGTFFLLVGGTLLILALEWEHALADFRWPQKLLIAFFQSVTTRTAGFNTILLENLRSATLFVFILLMVVGAGPCSTGGGAKVSTVVVLILQGWSRLRGNEQPVVFRRTIPRSATDRASLTVLLFTTFIVLGMVGILVGGEAFFQDRVTTPSAHGFFLESAFEVVSALGTVGLSMGITADLSAWSKVCLMMLMFAGRLGPISVVLAVSRQSRRTKMVYASQDVLTG